MDKGDKGEIDAWSTPQINLDNLVDTCRNQGVNFYQYILDRISKTFEMPPLATLIEQQSKLCLS